MVRLQDISYEQLEGDEQLDYPVKGPENSNLRFIGSFTTLKLQQDEDQTNYNGRKIAIKDAIPKEDREGIHMIIHDPYDVASDKSVNFFTMENQVVEYLIAPKIVMIDETLEGYDLKE
jgi:hypothetical protein